MALGAPGRTVVNLIVRQAMVLVLCGVTAGTTAALLMPLSRERRTSNSFRSGTS